MSRRSIDRASVGCDCKFNPLALGQIQNGADTTVKIIPFGLAKAVRDTAVAGLAEPLLRVTPYRIRKVGVVSTLVPGLPPKVIEETLQVTAERLAPAGAAIVAEHRVPHDPAALAVALNDVLEIGAELVIVFGASAVADRRDVIPAALEPVRGQTTANLVLS